MRRLAIATTLLLALGVLAGCTGSEDEPDASPSRTAPAPEDNPTESTYDGPDVPCAHEPVVTAALPDRVPAGATTVRLCPSESGKLRAPVDALRTDDVAAVVDAVNDQPLVRRHCVELRTPDYLLTFGYADGSRFVVAGRFTGCGELQVGSGRRARAEPALRAFVSGLRTQRAALDAPDAIPPDDLDCGWAPKATLPVAVAHLGDLAVAGLCFGDPRNPEDASLVPIADDDLELLNRSMRNDTVSSTGGFCEAVVGRDFWIVGVSEWLDLVVARRGCFGLTIEGDEEWAPRGEARAILRRLVSRAR